MVAAGPLAPARRAATLAAALALATTGCGALKAAEPEIVAQPGTVTTAPSGLSPGPYALTTEEGAVITFDLPTVPAPDDEVERLRQDLHVEPVTYVELHIDNTEGTRAVDIDDLKVISHEGGQFPFQPAADVLSEWDPDRSHEGGHWRADGTALGATEGAGLDARTHALITEYTGVVPAGVKGRELMIGDFEHLPRSFDDVELSPYPHERALGPAPVGHGPAQRQYRAGAPSPAPRKQIEAEPVPVAPARPVAQPPQPPAAEPGPAPVYVPDCSDAAQPSGPVQQAAWNAACAPVVEPLPVPTTAPTTPPVQEPEPEPEQTTPPPLPPSPPPPAQSPEPSPAETIAPAGGATVAEPVPTASPSASGRRPWPPGSDPVTQAAPEPTPSAPVAASTTPAPASSLPSGGDPA